MLKMNFVLPNGIEPISALPDELCDLSEAMGQPRFRGNQIFSWMHQQGIYDPNEMTNLPKKLRKELGDLDFSWPAQIGNRLKSKDGTRKLQVLLKDGYAVETVLIPDENKLTQCISCQVGCAVGCRFCRSGHDGLKRNLTAAEIIAQIHLARLEHLPGEHLRNVVLMGVGEPLHNLKNVLRVLKLLNHPSGLDLSSRRVTVSTVGITNGLKQLAQADGKVALAVSLHASNDQTRAWLVPGAKDSPNQIVEALKRYPLPKRMRFTIEYVLVKGVNDGDRDAAQLVKLLSRLKVKVNLLPLNPHDKTDLEPPSPKRVQAFQQVLIDKGVSVFLRRRRGEDIGAACGQLLSTTHRM